MVKPIEPEIKPIFTVPYTLYRYDRSDDDRYYYRFTEDEEGNEIRKAYLSVTSFVAKSLGIGQQLFDWASKVGKDHAIQYARYRAEYGTQMHIEIVNIVRLGGGSFEEISKRQRAICKSLGYGVWVEEWDNEMRRDILSFLKFLKDYEVEVIFAELPVYSDKYGLGGSIDFGMRLNFGRTRVNALVDLKSGKKGFFDGHDLQLGCYKVLWNDLFEHEFKVTHVFNWAPNAWRFSDSKALEDQPTYKLKNQTPFTYDVISRMEMALKEGWILPPDQHMEIKGSFTLDDYDIGNHIKSYAISRSVSDEEE